MTRGGVNVWWPVGPGKASDEGGSTPKEPRLW